MDLKKKQKPERSISTQKIIILVLVLENWMFTEEIV